jgi:nitrate/nitrite transport system ATP-binding protein
MSHLELRTSARVTAARKCCRHQSCRSRKGEFVALIGFSGSGKTTLMSILAGLVDPMRAKCACAASRGRRRPGSRRGVPELFADALAHGGRKTSRSAVDAVFAKESKQQRHALARTNTCAWVGLGARQPTGVRRALGRACASVSPWGARSSHINPEFLLL